MHKHRYDRHGFTIVELLIVIVVIAILAALTIIAFNGINNKAKIASLQTDLTNSYKQLAMDNIKDNKYPATTAAANGGQGLKASSGTTYEYEYDPATNLYCLTATNGSIVYSVKPNRNAPQPGGCNGGVVTTFVGSGASGVPGNPDGTGTAAVIYSPSGIAKDSSGNFYVSEGLGQRIRKITPAGVVTTPAGPLVAGSPGYADGTGTSAVFNYPNPIAVDNISGNIYVSDWGGDRIRKITPAGVVTTIAGSTNPTTSTYGFVNGTGSAVRFDRVVAMAVDSAGDLYVSDSANNRIRKVTSAGVVTTFVGSGTSAYVDGTSTGASLLSPGGLAFDSSNNLYFIDGSVRIRKATPAGVVTTVTGPWGSGSYADGTGSSASFVGLAPSLALSPSGYMYVADMMNHRVRKISPTGVVTTLAGSGTAGFSNGTSTTASFNYPVGVVLDAEGSVYVTDLQNHRVRKIQ